MTAPALTSPVGAGAAGVRIAYLGNFQPGLEPGLAARTGGPWSTETHIALSAESLGHQVARLQEGEVKARNLARAVQHSGADLFLWTCTHGLAARAGSNEEHHEAIRSIREAGIPSMSFHLDKWWDVRDGREDRIFTSAFFTTDLVATADEGGGRWEAAGVNAVYSPPGIYHGEAVRGTPRQEFVSPIAFVGSWRGHYHPEWAHRADLINHLMRRWGTRCAFWPKGEQIRGRALADLYASTTILIGDSFSPPGSRHYSDRVPETIGRGGALLHPRVPGLEDDYTAGEHLGVWDLGDWAGLDALIDHYLAHPDEARAMADRGHAHVLANHCYSHRLAGLIPMALQARAAVPA